jgi:hypothetical protein
MGDVNRDAAANDANREDAGSSPNWYERIVVIVVLITAFGVSIAAGMGYFQSAAISAFFVGVAAATHTFHFLGGVGDASWNTTGVKLGGSAAVLVAISGILFAQLSPEFARREERNSQAEKLMIILQQKDAKIVQLGKAISNVPKDDAERMLQVIQETGPEDPLGGQLIDMQKRNQGPWREVVAPGQTVQISFHKKVEKDGKRLFTACSALGLDGRRVRFAIGDRQTSGESEPVEAEWAGAVAGAYCEGEDATRVQLSCDSAVAMIPEFALGCSPTGEVKWAAGKDTRRFTGSAEILRQ